MRQCQVQRGFFTLRECGASAAASCEGCARPICPEHTSPQAGSMLCLDCGARQEQNQVLEEGGDAWTRPGWTYAMRHHTQRSGHLSPMVGVDSGRAFDEGDVAGFDRTAADEDVPDEPGDMPIDS